jgi:hypothetical protein
MKRSFTNYKDCHSGSRLDEFCARLFDFKPNGTYVDIGSAHSRDHNNSNFLDLRLGWRGLCVEQESRYNESYSDRKNCTYINDNALTVNYADVFAELNMPSSIDYLSLDVDVLDLDVAKILLATNYRFKVVGIEHDAYQYGDKYRTPQRELFLSKGYVLACADIYVRHPDIVDCPFEDWWLDSEYFNQNVIDKVKSESCYSEDVIVKLGGKA